MLCTGCDASLRFFKVGVSLTCHCHDAQIFKEGGCGFGLRTLEAVKKGQLVFEYVGEVIDDEMLNVSQSTVLCCVIV